MFEYSFRMIAQNLRKLDLSDFFQKDLKIQCVRFILMREILNLYL